MLDSSPLRGATRCISNGRTSPPGLSTSLPTTKYSTPLQHEPTWPFSEWNPSHHATAERRTTPSRDTGIWHKSKDAEGGEQTAQHNVIKKKHVPFSESPCSTPQLWHTDKSSRSHFQQPTLTPAPPNSGLGRSRATNVSRAPGNSARYMSHTTVPLLAGWMAAKMICGILFACSKTVVGTLTNIDRLACAHHVPLNIISPVIPKVRGATRSTVLARYRVFHISTRHVPLLCSLSFSSLGALMCYAAEQLKFACNEHLTRLSQLVGIVAPVSKF